MQSPVIVGLVSIIPGLGFVVLEKTMRGISVFVFIVGLLIVAMITPNKALSSFSFQFSLFLWMLQIFYAVRDAKHLAREKSGEIVVPKATKRVETPRGLKRSERVATKIRETVLQHLNPNEELIEAIIVQSIPSKKARIFGGVLSMLSIRQFFLALINDGVVVIELDYLGKPASISRYPTYSIRVTQYKKGWLMDKFTLAIEEEKPINVEVTVRDREQTELILSVLER